MVTTPTEDPVRCVVFYRMLIRVVELLADGRMMQGDITALRQGGWTFKTEPIERVRAVAEALVLKTNLARVLTVGVVLAPPRHSRSSGHNAQSPNIMAPVPMPESQSTKRMSAFTS